MKLWRNSSQFPSHKLERVKKISYLDIIENLVRSASYKTLHHLRNNKTHTHIFVALINIHTNVQFKYL